MSRLTPEQMAANQASNAARPARRLRWPLRGGSRLRYNNSPFFSGKVQAKRLARSKEAATVFASRMAVRSGWDALLTFLSGRRFSDNYRLRRGGMRQKKPG